MRQARAVQTISAAELRRRMAGGENVVRLDVRQPGTYADFPGAIPGSVRIPPTELPNRYDELPRDRPIVPY